MISLNHLFKCNLKCHLVTDIQKVDTMNSKVLRYRKYNFSHSKGLAFKYFPGEPPRGNKKVFAIIY